MPKLVSLVLTAVLLATAATAETDPEREAAIARESAQREAMLSGMQSVVDGINSGSFELLAAAIDPDDMLERIFGLRLIDQRLKKQYRENFAERLESTVEQTVGQRQNQSVKARLLKFASRGNQGKAVVRYELDNFQFSYHEYELTLDERDRLRVVDWTDFYWGERFSDGVGESLVIAAPGKPAVRKLVNVRNLSESQLFQVTEALKAIRDFQVARYLEIVGGMSEELKSQRIIVVGGVHMTKQARARRQLRTTLTALAEHYGEDPLYSNLLQRGGSAEEEPYYSALVAAGRAEPPSPTPSPSRASFPLSPGTARSSYGARSSKDDDGEMVR